MKAYLIVICDKDTNAVLGADIWSCPEWEASQRLSQRTYVAYSCDGIDFQGARDAILKSISDKRSRYNWLVDHLVERKTPHCIGATKTI